MRIFVYGEARDTDGGFEDYLDPSKTAVISIDMHRGHLDPSPDCPCPAPRAREIVARDLVRGTDDHLEGAALAMVSLHLGLVAESADLLAEWRRRKAGQNAA